MEYLAVIDTETTWDNRVMSIGAVVAEAGTYRPLDAVYYILTPEYEAGGMFSHVLFLQGTAPRLCSRREALEALCAWLQGYGATRLFAYNAGFDKSHLPELGQFVWHDIMQLAAYRQYNPAIPACADCYSTGRLKRGYGVEAILGLLSGDSCYRESHNALLDAMDELRILMLLGHGVDAYRPL